MINGPAVPAPNPPIFGVSQHKPAGQTVGDRLCLSPALGYGSVYEPEGTTEGHFLCHIMNNTDALTGVGRNGADNPEGQQPRQGGPRCQSREASRTGAEGRAWRVLRHRATAVAG